MIPPPIFTREKMIAKLRSTPDWDVVIIGGGATGLGVALDAALRGLKTALFEQSDFAKGTSSRSTKLVHGGVRYLAQGNIKLVRHALKERGLLLNNAPHLVKKQKFIIPCYSLFAKIKYLIGLKLYDWLSGKLSFGASRSLSAREVMNEIPGLKTRGLSGGIEYFDGQFDDARLAINLAETAVEEGAVALNYFKVEKLIKTNNLVSGLQCRDLETNEIFEVKSKTVVNATGVFVDDILQLDEEGKAPMVSPSQGVHVVLERSKFPGISALMIPETRDGRVLFAIPWHNHLLIGTTDTKVDAHTLEPKALDQEIDFILETVGQFVSPAPERKDILSIFAGLRPLAASSGNSQSTKEISRDHKLIVSNSQLITITGGKWTTYREMSEDVVNKAVSIGALQAKSVSTATRKIHGATTDASTGLYGTDQDLLDEVKREDEYFHQPIATGFPNIFAEVVWAVRYEMARKLEDVLARRTRILLLNAAAALQAAPAVARLMAKELGRDQVWIDQELKDFEILSKNYLPQNLN